MNIYLNEFFQKILLKKRFLNKLLVETGDLTNEKRETLKTSTKFSFLFSKIIKNFIKYDNLIVFILDITFSKSNTYINIMNSQGTLRFSRSSGSLFYSGKNKKARISILKSIIKILITKLKFLSNQPIALHLKNVKFMKRWIITKFKNKFFIKIIKNYSTYSHNGCRLAKSKRKK